MSTLSSDNLKFTDARAQNPFIRFVVNSEDYTLPRRGIVSPWNRNELMVGVQ
jgi:hypothetical protein